MVFSQFNFFVFGVSQFGHKELVNFELVNFIVNRINLFQKDNFYTQMLVKDEISSLVYCTKNRGQILLSLQFWTSPFDLGSWIAIVCTACLLTLLLRGQWLSVYAVLLRQDCRILEKQKLLIIFILVATIFNYGYEGIFSSLVIAPSPFLVFSSLRELLVNGYEVFNYDKTVYNHLRESCENDTFLLELLNRSISTDVQEFKSLEQISKRVAGCNSTAYMTAERVDGFSLEMRCVYGVYCHRTKDTPISQWRSFTYHGRLNSEFARSTQTLLESGIFAQLLQPMNVPALRQVKKELIIRDLRDRDTEKPLVLNDFKIQSIFVSWAGLLGVTVIAITVEIILKNYKSIQRVIFSLIFSYFKPYI